MITRTKKKTPRKKAKAKKVTADNRASAEAQAATPGNTEASLTQIREILFGHQARDFEERFGRLEQRLTSELNKVRDELQQRSQELESTVRKELGALGEQLKKETGERHESEKALSRQVRELGTQLEKKSAQLVDQWSATERALRQHMAAETKALWVELQSRYDELSEYIEGETTDIREATADRAALSELFKELSMRLSGELKRPAPRG